jgi:hypothetical protein
VFQAKSRGRGVDERFVQALSLSRLPVNRRLANAAAAKGAGLYLILPILLPRFLVAHTRGGRPWYRGGRWGLSNPRNQTAR